jgi:DNA/RNA endonuclease YhcR with UshA esterase domain
MKIKTVLTLSAVVCVASMACRPTGNAQTPQEAAQHVGETATITGAVDSVHQTGKGTIFLNMGGKYPNQAFTAYIPSSSAAQFPNPQQYEGRTVSVSGKITLYKGKPEITVNSPSQISVK